MAWKEEAIKNMGVSLLSSKTAVDAEAAVDLASSSINLVDECNKEDLDVDEVLEIAKRSRGKAMDGMNEMVNKGHSPIAAMVLPIAMSLIIRCEKWKIKEEDYPHILDVAKNYLEQDGWRG